LKKGEHHVETAFLVTAFLSYHETAVHTEIKIAGSQQEALETQQN